MGVSYEKDPANCCYLYLRIGRSGIRGDSSALRNLKASSAFRLYGGQEVARYYFDVREGDIVVPDKEGMDFPSLKSVQREAVHTLGDLAKSMPFEINEPGPQRAAIEVRDDDGPVLQIDFLVSWNVFRKQ
jgi:hypothetical protein